MGMALANKKLKQQDTAMPNITGKLSCYLKYMQKEQLIQSW